MRQYIGARYTIKVYENSLDPSSAEWEQTNFEPIVLVSYQNGSYLSKKTVPASVGNPADNPEYWVQTGFYNAQVAELRNDVDDLITDVDNIEDIIIPLTKRYIIISDSYGAYDDGSGNNFIDLMRTYTGLPANRMIGFWRGGSGFTKTDANKWYNMLTEVYNSTTNPETVTDIYCAGGANDVGASAATIEAAIDEFVTYSKTLFPNAVVHAAFIGITIANDFTNRDITIAGYKTIVKYGGHYVDNSEYILKRFGLILTMDNVHPNNSGVLAIATQLTNALSTGTCDVHYHTEPTMTTLISDTTLTGRMYMNRDNGVLEIGGKSGNLYASFSFSNSGAVANNSTILKMTDSMWFGGVNRSLVVDCFIDHDFTSSIPAVIYPSAVNTDGTIDVKIYFYDEGAKVVNTELNLYGRNTIVD